MNMLNFLRLNDPEVHQLSGLDVWQAAKSALRSIGLPFSLSETAITHTNLRWAPADPADKFRYFLVLQQLLNRVVFPRQLRLREYRMQFCMASIVQQYCRAMLPSLQHRSQMVTAAEALRDLSSAQGTPFCLCGIF
ncbi:MAG: hypothetical protein ACI9R3_002523 [Verrucomicrobiales bacterium]|jgi:hypothetical protein